MLGRRYVEFDVLMQWIHILRSDWWPGPTYTHRDTYPGEGRNVITAGALTHDSWDDFLWVDSDHLPSPAFVERLRQYPKTCKVVVGAYFLREYPFDLQAWEADPEEHGIVQIHPQRIMAMLDQPGLYEVGGGGTGWMFIRREIMERLATILGPTHLFDIHGWTAEMEAKLGAGVIIGEDVSFCIAVRKHLGEKIWLDTHPMIQSAHMGSERYGAPHWKAAHVIPAGSGLEEVILPPGYRVDAESADTPAPVALGNRAQRRHG